MTTKKFEILVLNQISQVGLKRFPEKAYKVSKDIANYGFSIPFATILGRVLWPIVFFIGIYNFAILIEGFFYAIAANANQPHLARYLGARDRRILAASVVG